MLRSALIAAMGQNGLGDLAPEHSAVVARGVAAFRYAREFQRLFPGAEHKVVEAKHDFGPPDHWRSAHDWLSRARLYDRYVVMLSTAVDIRPDGTIEVLKPPRFDLFEITEVLNGRNEEDVPKYKMQWTSTEDGAWSELVAEAGDSPVDSPAPRHFLNWRPAGASPSLFLLQIGITPCR